MFRRRFGRKFQENLFIWWKKFGEFVKLSGIWNAGGAEQAWSDSWLFPENLCFRRRRGRQNSRKVWNAGYGERRMQVYSQHDFASRNQRLRNFQSQSCRAKDMDFWRYIQQTENRYRLQLRRPIRQMSLQAKLAPEALQHRHCKMRRSKKFNFSVFFGNFRGRKRRRRRARQDINFWLKFSHAGWTWTQVHWSARQVDHVAARHLRSARLPLPIRQQVAVIRPRKRTLEFSCRTEHLNTFIFKLKKKKKKK